MDDPLREAKKRIEEIAPEAARIALAGYLGRPSRELEKDIAAGIMQAIGKLPAKGRIIKRKDQAVVKALTYLLDEVATTDKRRPELARMLSELVQRTPGMS